jgi:hypothetical protein
VRRRRSSSSLTAHRVDDHCRRAEAMASKLAAAEHRVQEQMQEQEQAAARVEQVSEAECARARERERERERDYIIIYYISI